MHGDLPLPGCRKPRRGRWFDRRRAAASRAFTLVELLLVTAILALVMVVLTGMVNQTGSMWRHATAKIEEFRDARDGFEAVTRRLSQATLNTYWDYDNPNQPKKFIRQSELRFISGPGLAGDGNSTPPRPTHSTFFFAPLGFVIPADAADTASVNYRELNNLLNLWGYFVEYADDSAYRPAFVQTPVRTRFRLMELMQPSQSLNLYSLEAAAATSAQPNGNIAYIGRDWFSAPVDMSPTAAANAPARPAHILSENIVALILLPKLTPTEQKAGNYTDASLAPGYVYDSTGTGMTTISDPKLNPKSQLPPIVQVAMVAIDETSALRMSALDAQALEVQMGSLFSDPKNLSQDLTGQPSEPAGGSLETFLTGKHINYRVFTSDVSIRAAKWSTNQTN